jgi:hypothetical protein
MNFFHRPSSVVPQIQIDRQLNETDQSRCEETEIRHSPAVLIGIQHTVP